MSQLEHLEKVASCRRMLQELLPGLLVGNYSSMDARRIVRDEAAKRIATVDSIADTWAQLEREMELEHE